MSLKTERSYNRTTKRAGAKAASANVTVIHLGPKDQDLNALSEILDATDWKMCPGTKWNLTTAEDLPAADQLQPDSMPIVLCDQQSGVGSWKQVLERIGSFAAPPMLIVASRTADEYLWAEALNLGAYDVLSKPYHPAEVVRVLSMAWLHWMHRSAPAMRFAQAS